MTAAEHLQTIRSMIADLNHGAAWWIKVAEKRPEHGVSAARAGQAAARALTAAATLAERLGDLHFCETNEPAAGINLDVETRDP